MKNKNTAKDFRISSPRNQTCKRLILNYDFMNFISRFDYEPIKIMQKNYFIVVGCNWRRRFWGLIQKNMQRKNENQPNQKIKSNKNVGGGGDVRSCMPVIRASLSLNMYSFCFKSPRAMLLIFMTIWEIGYLKFNQFSVISFNQIKHHGVEAGNMDF